MDIRLIGSFSFAAVAVAMLVAQIAGRETSAVTSDMDTYSAYEKVIISPASGQIQRALPPEAPEVLAYSTIFPSFVPHTLPVADMVDIAIQGSLIKDAEKKTPTPDTPPPSLNDSDDAARALPGQSMQFRTVMTPGGYNRPQWQDVHASLGLGRGYTRRTAPFVVMIDPGHGGTDPGAEGHNGLTEKELTLDIARRVRLFLLEVEHIDVQLTRNHDYGLSRQARVNAIKRSEADMVISLHFNHLPQSQINLVESYYAGPDNVLQSQSALHQHAHADLHRTRATASTGIDLSFTDGSARLANTLQKHIYSEVSFENDEVQDAGVKQETLFVLTRSFTPGVLLEISCLSHAPEADRLTSDDYRNRLAAALVDGIRSYHDSLQRDPLKKRGDIGV